MAEQKFKVGDRVKITEFLEDEKPTSIEWLLGKKDKNE